ncbi:MAG: hypothetical protein AB1938_12270 [Myxococcota bacterium]
MRRMLVLVALAVAGCGSSAKLNMTPAVTAVGTPSGPEVTGVIGPAGGRLASSDGLFTLEVPPGAVAGDTTFTVSALLNTAPGAVRTYRVGPDGTTFLSPATVRFSFTEAELAGSTPEGFRIAFQDEQRRWEILKSVGVDAQARTVSGTTTHLSDWSLLQGWQLRPPTARVKVGGTLELSARFCNVVELDGLTGLAAECQDSAEELSPLLRDWSVNGTVGGSGSTGTVSPGSPSATYSAPREVPSPPTVAVSVQLDTPKAGKVVLVSNVTVTDDDVVLPQRIEGSFTYSKRGGGPGTSTAEARISGTGRVVFTPWPEQGPYAYKMSGTFTVTEDYHDLGSCKCTGSGAMGSLEDQDNSLTYLVSKNQIRFGFSASGTIAVTCTKTDPSANCQTERPWGAGWSLTTSAGSCDRSFENGYTDPWMLNGSWSQTCYLDGVAASEERVTWTFAGQ